MSFALAALADGMQAYVASQKVPGLVIEFGWRQREQVINQGVGAGLGAGGGAANRVVVWPGDPDSGDAGILYRGHQTSFNPRILANWHKIGNVSIWGVDTTDLQSEKKQVTATENLLVVVVQSIHNAMDHATGDLLGVGNLSWKGLKWSPKPTNQYFGRELILTFEQRGPLEDFTYQVTTTASPAIVREPIT